MSTSKMKKHELCTLQRDVESQGSILDTSNCSASSIYTENCPIASQSHSHSPRSLYGSFKLTNNGRNATVAARGIKGNRNNLSSEQVFGHQQQFPSKDEFKGRNMNQCHNGFFSPPSLPASRRISEMAHNVPSSSSDFYLKNNNNDNSSKTIEDLYTSGCFYKDELSNRQKLDMFLEWYEKTQGLQPIEKSAAQSSSTLVTSGLIMATPSQKTGETQRQDSQKIASVSSQCSADLSWLPAAGTRLTQDDIQDKRIKNTSNNGISQDVDYVDISSKQATLSPIRNIVLKDATQKRAPMEMGTTASPSADSFAKKMTDSERVNTPPTTKQQPQSNENLRKIKREGTFTKEETKSKGNSMNCDVRQTNISSSSLLPRKSKIPVPLPKAKVNRATSTASQVGGSKQVQVDRKEKAAETDRVRHTSDNNFPLKSVWSETRISPAEASANSEGSDCETALSRRKIGEGDEISECLSLIDGLSGHTAWVMRKLLELPNSEEDAWRKTKQLRKFPSGIGDFFGAPYIKKEVLAHLIFSGGGRNSQENIGSKFLIF